MATFDAVFSKGSVAQMSQKEFPCKSEIFFEVLGVFKQGGVFGCSFVDFGEDVAKHFLYGTGTDGAFSGNVPFPGFHVEFDIGNTGPVLSTVVLFLHQEVKLVQAVEGRSVFFYVVVKGFEEAQYNNTAFVLDVIAHNGKNRAAKIHLFPLPFPHFLAHSRQQIGGFGVY
jgi:hypothetical protein